MTKKAPPLRQPKPETKETIRLGPELVDVYPEYCVRVTRHCAQCVAEGKIQCTYASEKRPTRGGHALQNERK